MAVRYIDFNRGSDAADGATPATAWKNLLMAYNFNPGAGGGLYLASDSVWDVQYGVAAHGSLVQTQFNGGAGNPAFIYPYDPVANTTGSKPTIRYRMFPTPSDWTWDATDNFGYPKGWYIQFQWHGLTNDVLVLVGGQYVGTTNQSTPLGAGYGSINGDYQGVHQGQFVNGITRQTLRFNIDLSKTSVGGSTFTRLYLSGAGLLTSGAGNDPSSVFGPGQIMVALRPYIYLFNSGSNVDIAGLRCEQGGGLFYMGADPNRVASGFVCRENVFDQTQTPFMLLQGSGSSALTRVELDIRDNVATNQAGSVLSAYKIGYTGKFRRNRMVRGNLCNSVGGSVYMQVESSTYSGKAEPFVVEDNYVERWANGTGNNTYDGGGYYVDLGDTGTILRNNTAKDCYVAFQAGNGQKSVWLNNVSLNCEKFGLWTNAATAAQTTDYTVDGNLHIGAPQGTWPHGQDTEQSPCAAIMDHNGTLSNLIKVRFRNNAIVLAPGDTRRAIRILQPSAWDSGQVDCRNNAIVCDSAIKIGTDPLGETDKTVSAQTLITTAAACRLATTDGLAYTIDRLSSLYRAGCDVADVLPNDDRTGRRRYSPPSIGPYEVPRPPSYHWAAV